MTILVFRHIPGNTLGCLEVVLHARQIPFQYLDVFALDDKTLQKAVFKDGLKGLIVLGGRESVIDEHSLAFMPPELKLMAEAVTSELPVFGICLGSQLLARCLGGTVSRNPVKEVGWLPLQLTAAGKTDPVLSTLHGVRQFQWHEDTFSCPPGSGHLARSKLCENQAFRFGKHAYGVQFHPEVTPEIIEVWIQQSTSLSEGQAHEMRAQTQQYYLKASLKSQQMFDQFCSLAAW